MNECYLLILTFQLIRHKEYDFATHVVRVKRSGQVVDVKSLWEVETEGGKKLIVTMNIGIYNINFSLESAPLTASAKFTDFQRSTFGRLNSIRAFSVTSEANEMLKGLRYFERPSKANAPQKDPLSWGKVSIKHV